MGVQARVVQVPAQRRRNEQELGGWSCTAGKGVRAVRRKAVLASIDDRTKIKIGWGIKYKFGLALGIFKLMKKDVWNVFLSVSKILADFAAYEM